MYPYFDVVGVVKYLLGMLGIAAGVVFIVEGASAEVVP